MPIFSMPRQQASKIAIPGLPNKRHDPSPPKSNVVRTSRVVRACLSCRVRKIKCSGATPRCAHCRDNPEPCVYAGSRKDRLKTSTAQNQDMMTLLRDLRAQVAETEQQKIDAMLAAVTDDVDDAAATLRSTRDKSTREGTECDLSEEQGEAHISAEVDSSVNLDLLDEDLLRNEHTRATGFMGKASETQWLRGLHSRDREADQHGPYGPPGASPEAQAQRLIALRQRQGQQTSTQIHTNQASYFLDDELFEFDLEVDQYELPSFEIAENLMQTFLRSCHGSFPMLIKKTFVHQFYHYYAALRRGQPHTPPEKWQAQLNLVFAIGAVNAHLTSIEWQGDERDHLIYHSRAWALASKDPWWFSHLDLPQMQTAGLLSFYYLSVGHINRAWVLIGMALRCGYAMGLHIRNEDSSTDAARREQLARVWWGHYALDRYLATITGRPSVGLNGICSVPLPLPLSSADIEKSIIESRYGDRITTSTSIAAGKRRASDPASPQISDIKGSTYATGLDPANSGSYLKNIVRWGEITQDALDLYQASTVGESWASIQNVIAQLTEDLEMWATSLPESFHFFNKRPGSGQRYERQRNTLEIFYHSTKILVTRPCLCRLDRRIREQTVRSSEFNQRAALACVESAKSIAKLLPDDPDQNLRVLYECGPWWNMVHTIMQSLVILLLELSNGTVHSTQRQDIIEPLKKLVRWLRVMQVNNGMAKRAYSIVLDLLRNLVATIPMDIADFLREHEPAQDAIPTDTSPTSDARGKGAVIHSSTLDPYMQRSQRPSNATTRSTQYDQLHYQDYTNTSTDPSRNMRGAYVDRAPPTANKDNRNASPNTHMDIFMQSWVDQGSVFPGLFFTSFDEQNALPGFQLDSLEESNFGGSSRRSPRTD